MNTGHNSGQISVRNSERRSGNGPINRTNLRANKARDPTMPFSRESQVARIHNQCKQLYARFIFYANRLYIFSFARPISRIASPSINGSFFLRRDQPFCNRSSKDVQSSQHLRLVLASRAQEAIETLDCKRYVPKCT